ncbi:MAG: hypothetical protein R2795_20895 [Saprospiraceae bacterium]
MSPDTIQTIRALIVRAKNEEAAEQLLQAVTAEGGAVATWSDTIRNLLAQYKRIRLEQQRNTIAFEDAQQAINRVTTGLLEVLAAVEEGKPAPENAPAIAGMPIWKKSMLAFAVLAAMALVGYIFFGPTDDPIVPTEKPPVEVPSGEVEENACPPYPVQSKFNIMVLPYQPLDGKLKEVEKALRIRLANKMEEHRIAGSVYTRGIDVDSDEYPVTNSQAVAIGQPCKAQLVIWGTTEEKGNGIITTTKFRFIDSENFSLADLSLNSNMEVDTVSSISSIATSAELTENIEKTLRLIFGLVAYETDDFELAATLLDTVIEERGGVGSNPEWGMIQADSYIRSGQEKRAIEVYDKMLQRDSTNVQAWRQKGLLEYKTGNLLEAERALGLLFVINPMIPKH